MTYLRKFEFTGVEKTLNYGDEGDFVFKQIRALFDIPAHGVKTGDIGGYLEDESCLSHFGNAWVADSAMIHNSSCVSGDALVKDNAMLLLNCYLYGTVTVSGNARLYSTNLQGDAILVQENATIEGSRIHGNEMTFKGYSHLQNVDSRQNISQFEVSGEAQILNVNLAKKTMLEGEQILLTGNAQLLNIPSISGKNVEVNGHCVLDTASINGENILIEDMCFVKGHTIISSNVKLSDMVTVTSSFGSSVRDVSLSGDKVYYAEALAGA